MNLIDCDTSFSKAILAILNEAIVNSTALYDYEPRTIESMERWFAAKQQGNFPVIGAVDSTGELLGFASYGVFRGYAANKYTVEHSLYVAAAHRGKGIGWQLLTAIVEKAQCQNFHLLVGCIDSTNAASIKLHKTLGFEYAGTIKEIGFKFGRWLDLDFYQRILQTPLRPVDG